MEPRKIYHQSLVANNLEIHVMDVSAGSSSGGCGVRQRRACHTEYEVSIEENKAHDGVPTMDYLQVHDSESESDRPENDSGSEEHLRRPSDEITDSLNNSTDVLSSSRRSPCDPAGALSLKRKSRSGSSLTSKIKSHLRSTAPSGMPKILRPSLAQRQSSAPSLSPYLPDIKIKIPLPMPSLRNIRQTSVPDRCHAKALLNSDEELERFVHNLRSEIRQSEMIELAFEAERAAAAGQESFSGKASTFVTEESGEEGSHSQSIEPSGEPPLHQYPDLDPHPSPIPLRSTISGYFPNLSPLPLGGRVSSMPVIGSAAAPSFDNSTAQNGEASPVVSYIPPTAEKRKMRVLALRDVSEVIPDWNDLHAHMKMHMSRRAVDEGYLKVDEVEEVYVSGTLPDIRISTETKTTSKPGNEAIEVASSAANASAGTPGNAYTFLENIVQTVLSANISDVADGDENDKDHAASLYNDDESRSSMSDCAGEILSSQTVGKSVRRPAIPSLPGLFDSFESDEEEEALNESKTRPNNLHLSRRLRLVRRLSACNTPANISPKELERKLLDFDECGVGAMPALETIHSNSFSFDGNEEEKKEDYTAEPIRHPDVKPIALFDSEDDDFLAKSSFDEDENPQSLPPLPTHPLSAKHVDGVLNTPRESSWPKRSNSAGVSDFVTPARLRDIRDERQSITPSGQENQEKANGPANQTPESTFVPLQPSSIVDSGNHNGKKKVVPSLSTLNSLRKDHAARFLALPSIQDTSKDSDESNALSFSSDNEPRRRSRHMMRRPSGNLSIEDIAALSTNNTSKSWDDSFRTGVQELNATISLDSPRRSLDSSFNIFDPDEAPSASPFRPLQKDPIGSQNPLTVMQLSPSMERLDDPDTRSVSGNADEERQDIASANMPCILPCKSLDYGTHTSMPRRVSAHRTALSDGCFDSVADALENSGSRFMLDLEGPPQNHLECPSVASSRQLKCDSSCGESISEGPSGTNSIFVDDPSSSGEERAIEIIPRVGSGQSLSDAIKPSLDALSISVDEGDSVLCGSFSDTGHNFAAALPVASITKTVASLSKNTMMGHKTDGKNSFSADQFMGILSKLSGQMLDESDGEDDVAVISDADNNDFLSNYFYCSKPEEPKEEVAPLTPQIETIACAEPCMNENQYCDSGMENMCTGFSLLLSSAINSKNQKSSNGKATEADGHLSLERDDEVEMIEAESWFGVFGSVSTRINFNVVSDLIRHAENKEPTKFQPPGLKKSCTYPSPAKAQPKTPSSGRKRSKSTDHSKHAVDAYNSNNFTDEQFEHMYGMTRVQFLALVDPKRWHAMACYGRRLPHLIPVSVANFDPDYSGSSTTNLERARYSSFGTLPNMPSLTTENLNEHDNSYSGPGRNR